MAYIKIPGIYKHFKGNKYVTMAISKPVPVLLVRKEGEYIAHHTELNKKIRVINKKGIWYHESQIESKPLVLYKSLYDDTGIYARRMSMFLEEVDKGRPDNITKQKYRFEIIRY